MAGNDVCLQSGNHPEKEIGDERGTSVSSGGILESQILIFFICILVDDGLEQVYKEKEFLSLDFFVFVYLHFSRW